MIGSVRTRLTAAAAVAVATLAVAAALAAPRLVRTALVDDRLDAESARDEAILGADRVVISYADGRPLGPDEMTAVFGPKIATLAAALDGTAAMTELQSYTDDGSIIVAPARGVIARISADGSIAVSHGDPADVDGPVVTGHRFEELATVFERERDVPDLFDLFGDDTTYDEFIAELDRQFGTDIADRFDLDTMRNVFDVLQSELGDAEAPAGLAEPNVVRPDDYLFGIRTVAGVPTIVGADGSGIDGSVHRVRSLLWAAVPIATLIAAALTWLLAGRALRPVRAITARTAEIRASTLHQRVPVPDGHDEIHDLAVEMNTMLDRVQREDDRRRQFVADASHELRSPIAVLRVQAESALHTGADDTTTELAGGVLAEAERLGGVVDDLLALARHDAELPPPGQILDLDDVVLAEARRHRRVPIDTGAVSAGQVRGRSDELTRVVAHLLDNAARHATSAVRVGLGAVDGEVVLTVDDDGPGVAPDDRARIFERFVRLDDARTRDEGGAGLGLAVVAAVARASGGSVSATDSELGGARFELRLPAA